MQETLSRLLETIEDFQAVFKSKTSFSEQDYHRWLVPVSKQGEALFFEAVQQAPTATLDELIYGEEPDHERGLQLLRETMAEFGLPCIAGQTADILVVFCAAEDLNSDYYPAAAAEFSGLFDRIVPRLQRVFGLLDSEIELTETETRMLHRIAELNKSGVKVTRRMIEDDYHLEGDRQRLLQRLVELELVQPGVKGRGSKGFRVTDLGKRRMVPPI